MTTSPSGTLTLSPQLVLQLEDYNKSGLHVAVLGATGAGKSNAVRVFCEQALRCGITTVVVDPEGEYYTLGDAFPTIVVGGEHGHVALPAGQLDDYAKPAAALAQLAIAHQGIAIVLDLSLLSKPTQQEAYQAFSAVLFQFKLTDSPLVFVTEEAELFAPERGAGKSRCIDTAEAIAKRGRKRGIISVWAPHRTADLSKRILSQCGLTLIGRLNWEGDFRAVQHYLPPTATFETVKDLPLGHFYVSASGQVVKMNKSQTANPGDETNGRVATVTTPANMATLIKALTQVFSNQDDSQKKSPVTGPAGGQPVAPSAQVAALQEAVGRETARAGRAELGLRRSDEALKGLEKERDGLKLRLQKAYEELKTTEKEHNDTRQFRVELVRFLGLGSEVKVALHGSPQQVAELAQLVRQQLVQEGFGQGGGPTVVEVRQAVLLDFQRDTVERILAKARAATPQARKALLWLEATGKPTSVTDIAKAFGITQAQGDPFMRFGRDLRALSGELTRHENRWISSNIRPLVQEELGRHAATEEQVEAVVQRVMVELRKGGD